MLRPREGWRVIGLVILVVMGALVGWMASVTLRADGQRTMGTFLNIVAGIAGAGIGAVLFQVYALDGTDMNHGISLYSSMVSLVGAVVVLGAVTVLRQI